MREARFFVIESHCGLWRGQHLQGVALFKFAVEQDFDENRAGFAQGQTGENLNGGEVRKQAVQFKVDGFARDDDVVVAVHEAGLLRAFAFAVAPFVDHATTGMLRRKLRDGDLLEQTEQH
jgi:hypothetical protein